MRRQIRIPRSRAAGRRSRALDWVDVRTGIRALISMVLDEPIPGGARWAYVFGSGCCSSFFFRCHRCFPGALLHPHGRDGAHQRGLHHQAGGRRSIPSQPALLRLQRDDHCSGAAFSADLSLWLIQGTPRVVMAVGALLSFLVLGMGFTGYLLPWDQKAYFATAVGTNVAGQVPIIGNLITRLLRGGETIGTLTLSRFYVAHVFLIPAAILVVCWRAYSPVSQGGSRRSDAEASGHLQSFRPEPFYPAPGVCLTWDSRC